MKKTNNKGFSLVELIVVIAIMAVLMVVVGPQLLKNVDKARIQRDNSAISEIANAAKIAMADQDIYDEVLATADKKATITFDGTNYKIDYTGTTAKLKADLTTVIGADVTLNSATYKKSGAIPTITVAITGTPERVVVTAKTMYKNDGVTPDGNSGEVTY